ncbi:MAG: hypothetical protein JO301_04010 [Chitinophagaceae bacterium]|nr:hypothetical protein [Chitinophagaceae bacterium]
MKKVIITGANGMIGGIILRHCLERNDVSRIVSIGRKKTGISHPKLLEVLHDDFLNFSAIAPHFENQDLCFFCIGVYTGQVSREEFRKITVDVTAAFARTLKERSPDAAFCFLSGQGADRSEKSRIMFAKDKGIAENMLVNLGFKQLSIFRPGYIYPVTRRKEPNFSYRIFRALYKPVLSNLFPWATITSEQLAAAMIQAGFNGGPKMIYENSEIKDLLN